MTYLRFPGQVGEETQVLHFVALRLRYDLKVEGGVFVFVVYRKQFHRLAEVYVQYRGPNRRGK